METQRNLETLCRRFEAHAAPKTYKIDIYIRRKHINEGRRGLRRAKDNLQSWEKFCDMSYLRVWMRDESEINPDVGSLNNWCIIWLN